MGHNEATLKSTTATIDKKKREVMPRITRGETVGGIYHIINRANMKMKVFDDA